MTPDMWLSTEEGPDVGPQVIFGLDRTGVCTLSIGSGLSALGFSSGQLVGQDLFEVYRGDPLGTEALTRALAGEVFRGERQYNGRRLALYFEPVLDDDGSVTGALGVATDVTEQRRAERTARAARLQAQQLAELSAVLTLEVLDLPELRKIVVMAITEGTADVGVLWTLAPGGKELTPSAQWDRLEFDREVPELTEPQGPEPPAYRCPAAVVEQAPAPESLVLAAASTDPSGPEALLRALAGPRMAGSALRIPLHSRGQLIGMVDIARTRTNKPFSAHEIDVVADIAERCALALDNAQLLDDQRVASEELMKFRALADASDNYIGISDTNDRLVYLNPRARQAGIRDDAPDAWEALASWVGPKEAEAVHSEVAATGRWSGALPADPPDAARGTLPDELVTYLDVFGLQHPDTGVVLGRAWVARDITELRATAHALRLANADLRRFEALVEASMDFIAIAELDGRVRYVNPGGRALVGLDADADVSATTIADYLTPEGLVASIEIEQPAVIQHGHWNGKSTLRHHRGGEPIPVAVASFLMRDTVTGDPFALATVQRDLTDLVAAETALARLAQQRAVLLTRLVVAQDAERVRIANDVHDDTVQALAAVDLRLGLLRRRLREQAPDLLTELDSLQETVSGATERLRALLFDLEPPDLADGLSAALARAGDELFEGTPTSCRVEGDDEPRMPEASRAVAYRIAKEALVNVLKHAKARRVLVSVTGADDGLQVEVHDDGVGAGDTVNDNLAGHRGVSGMRDRATLAGGRCTFGVSPYGGTSMTLWLPGGPQ
jgi:PAS domain S-box-containing protein